MLSVRRSNSYYYALMKNSAFMGEGDLDQRTGYWDTLSIDSTQYAHDVLRSIDELDELDKLCKKGELIDTLSYDLPSENLTSKSIIIALSKFFDNTAGAFIQAASLFPDSYSIDDAYRMIFKYGNWDFSKDQASEVKAGKIEKNDIVSKWIERSHHYISRCKREDGLFLQYPKGKPSLTATSSCMSSLSALEKYGFYEKEDHEYDAETIIKYILDFRSLERNGFAYDKSGSPTLCATFFGLSTLGRLNVDKERLKEELDIDGIADFIHNSEGNEGGYSSRSGTLENIVHTRYALQIIRFLVTHDLFTDKAKNDLLSSPEKVVRFVNSHISGDGYGIDFGLAPTLYSTRAAIKSIKLMRLFELYGLFSENWRYNREIRKFHRSIPKMKKFLAACADASGLVYSGIPFSVSERSQSSSS